MGIISSMIIILLGLFMLRFKTPTSNKIITIFAIYLLIYKTVEYTLYGLNLQVSKIPIEYSTITYFLFSIQVIFGIKSLKPIASFMGFVSGLGYLIVFMFLATQYIEHQGQFTTMMAFVNHSIVFMGSLLLMKSEQFHKMDKRAILSFTMIYLIYVIIVNQFVIFTQSYIFILMLLQGDLLERLAPSGRLSAIDYLSYFLAIFLIYQLCIQVFIWLSSRIYQMKRGRKHEYTI